MRQHELGSFLEFLRRIHRSGAQHDCQCLSSIQDGCMLKDAKLESASTEDTTLLSPLKSIAMEKRSQSTSVVEASARLSHRETLASAFTNALGLGLLGSKDRSSGPLYVRISQIARRDFSHLTFLTITDKTAPQIQFGTCHPLHSLKCYPAHSNLRHDANG